MIEYRCRAIIFETLFDSYVLARIHAAEALSLSSNHHHDSKISRSCVRELARLSDRACVTDCEIDRIPSGSHFPLGVFFNSVI